ncbi:MAG TPA: response regulator [Bryobacteraceae bacterium]|nr:response regulator [Bryobacteraceae bacterium]
MMRLVGTVLARKSHTVSLGIAMGVVLAVGTLSYGNWREYEQAVENADRVRNTIDRAQQLLSLLKDAETGQRGYLLTGEDTYLGPYRESVPQIRRIQLYDAGAPSADPGDAEQLTGLVAAKLSELARTIEVRRQGRVEDALAIVRANQGKEIMDQVRAAAARLMAAEEKQLRAREAAANRHERETRIAILGGTGILVLLLIGAAAHLDRAFTALDRAHAEERHQRALVETTLRSIGDAVITTDKAGVVTFVNPVAESLTGWKAAEAVGQPLGNVFRIVNETTREEVTSPAAKVLQNGTTVGLANHTLLISRDGKENPIDDSGAPIRSEHGGIAGVVLVFRDVAERRRAERQIEDSERRYRLLFEHNPQPMWVFDAGTLAFLAVNNAAVYTYGYTREEFLAMTLRDIRPAEDVPALLEDVRSEKSAALHRDGPWRHRKKDGTVITVEVMTHPLDFGGRHARLVLVTDITERHKLEEQLRQAQRLESIGRLAGGVAHDFNNLLTVINGYSEMMLHELRAGDQMKEPMAQVLAAGERAAALTQQLLAFSRKQLIQPTVLKVNDIVLDIERMLRRLIGEDIRLLTKLSPDLGNVTADGGQLQQVIMNLAINARDAMPEGGTLLLETANVSLDEEHAAVEPGAQAGEYVMLAVSDTGVGMSPEVKARLFEPFFTTKPKGIGTGLGLATVYGIVKQSGGWIQVSTQPGSGSTFKIYLPRTQELSAEPRRARKADTRGSETILVVEDQPEVLALAAAALRRCGYTVLSAAGGEEALRFASTFPEKIDLLLTDVVMPGMDGRTLASRLKAERPDIHILFMSGYTENAITNRPVPDAEVSYLQKPFTPDALALKVRQVLGPRALSANLLVVDDDESVRTLLRDLLRSAGFVVWEAANGRQAAQIAAQEDVDLVLTDLAMPEQDGIELIASLHMRKPSLKVIAMSGAFGGDMLPVAKNLGAAATLRKPISRDALLRTIHEVLER